MYRYYAIDHEDPNEDEIVSLLDASGVRCVRLPWTEEYRDIVTHQQALMKGIVPVVIDRYGEDEDVETSTPSLMEELASPLTVMGQVEYFYHNPVYPYWRSQEEFDRLYRLLFPSDGTYDCFCWSDDWCDFFDAGREWFGTGCWSVYDRRRRLFTLFFVSETD
ncbi:MAG: hypothetical protein GX181_05325 [Synergistaceae bacterium]|nr:hypothetical protein [Synergistota bacterium]NLM71362.1 hypothetical protein [Synergistaceae bacterium]